MVATSLTALHQFGDAEAISGNQDLRKSVAKLRTKAPGKVKRLASKLTQEIRTIGRCPLRRLPWQWCMNASKARGFCSAGGTAGRRATPCMTSRARRYVSEDAVCRILLALATRPLSDAALRAVLEELEGGHDPHLRCRRRNGLARLPSAKPRLRFLCAASPGEHDAP